MKANWKCRLLGHRDDDPEAIYNYFVCGRCGACEYDEDFSIPWHIAAIGRFRARMSLHAARWKSWLSPCEDCGKRFWRHDENIDHIPF